MCLEYITRRYCANDNICVAYKAMKAKTIKGVESYRLEFRHLYSKRIRLGDIKKDNWARSTSSMHSGDYDLGFHCFTNKRKALKYAREKGLVVIRVHLWDIRTRGMQFDQNVVVGKNIQFIEKVSDGK